MLDFDSGEMTLGQAVENEFPDYRHVIGITKSHQKDKNGIICDRFRVLLEFAETIRDLDQYRQNMAALIREYGADNQCKDGARFFYPCTRIVSVNNDVDGEKVGVKPLVKTKRSSNVDYQHYKKLGAYPPFVMRNLSNPIQEGSRDKTIYGVAKDLAKCGYPLSLILQEVSNSPTYTAADADHQKRFERACQSGFHDGSKSKANS